MAKITYKQATKHIELYVFSPTVPPLTILWIWYRLLCLSGFGYDWLLLGYSYVALLYFVMLIKQFSFWGFLVLIILPEPCYHSFTF